MIDIQNAINIEDEYIQYRLNGEEPFHLIDKIQECGFNTLEEYFEQKTEYLVSNTTFTLAELPFDNAIIESVLNLISSKKPGIILANTDITAVYHGSEDFNREYCEEHNIPVIDYYTNGGNIITSDGELSVAICIPASTGASVKWLLYKLRDILSKYMDNVVVDHNDIMVDGKKVSGSAVYSSEDTLGFVAHFSFNDKSELISAICPPPKSGKIPGFISKLTREQFRQEIIEWLL